MWFKIKISVCEPGEIRMNIVSKVAYACAGVLTITSLFFWETSPMIFFMLVYGYIRDDEFCTTGEGVKNG